MWTAWARQDTVKVTWVTYWSTLFSFQENGNMLDIFHRNRPIMAPFAWGWSLFALFVLAPFTSNLGILNYWKLPWLKTFEMKTCQSGTDGNPDVRLRNTALVNRCSKMGGRQEWSAHKVVVIVDRTEKWIRHLKDESQSKKQQLRKHAVQLSQLVSHYAQQQMLLHYLEYGCIFKPGMKARHKPEFGVYLTLECTHALF